MATIAVDVDSEETEYLLSKNGLFHRQSTKRPSSLGMLIISSVALFACLIVVAEIIYIISMKFSHAYEIEKIHHPTVSPSLSPTYLPPTFRPSLQTIKSRFIVDNNFTVKSPAFNEGEQLPLNYTCDAPRNPDTDPSNGNGDYQQNPPLSWFNEPNGTVEYLLLMTSHIKTLYQDYYKVDWSFWNFSASCSNSIPTNVRLGYCNLQYGGSFNLDDGDQCESLLRTHFVIYIP